MNLWIYYDDLRKRRICKNKSEFHRVWLQTGNHTYLSTIDAQGREPSATVVVRLYGNLLHAGLPDLAMRLHGEMISKTSTNEIVQ